MFLEDTAEPVIEEKTPPTRPPTATTTPTAKKDPSINTQRATTTR
ncbi:hypothetical protein ABZ714_22090 [Streptomyces sp. NPDC006798]